MTENVLEISVLWQLCIRLIYGMAFECELRYNKSKYKNILFVKFIIVNINFTLIFNIFYFFVIYILSYNPYSNPKQKPLQTTRFK